MDSHNDLPREKIGEKRLGSDLNKQFQRTMKSRWECAC